MRRLDDLWLPRHKAFQADVVKEMDRAGYAGHIVVEVSLMVQRRPDYDALQAATRSYRILSRAFVEAGVSRTNIRG